MCIVRDAQKTFPSAPLHSRDSGPDFAPLYLALTSGPLFSTLKKNSIKSKGALHPHIAHNKVTREVTSHDSSCGPRFKSAVWTRDFNQSLTTLPSPTHKSLNWSRGDVILFSLFTRSISFLVPYHGEFCAIRKPTGRPRLEFVQIILFWNSSKLFYSSPNALYT